LPTHGFHRIFCAKAREGVQYFVQKQGCSILCKSKRRGAVFCAKAREGEQYFVQKQEKGCSILCKSKRRGAVFCAKAREGVQYFVQKQEKGCSIFLQLRTLKRRAGTVPVRISHIPVNTLSLRYYDYNCWVWFINNHRIKYQDNKKTKKKPL